MLKTLDILIGTVTVLLIFSMAVTVITQVITGVLNRKGKHLRDGLTNLLRQLGIPRTDIAKSIAEKVLEHPMISAGGRLGTVIHREEFTKLLLDLAAGEGATKLEDDVKNELVAVLKNGGISDPAEALRNINDMALQLEAANPDLANHVRAALAVLHGVPSQFVSRVHSWFDQSIDRVSDRFTEYTHAVVVGVSLVVVLFVQLDIITIVNRLSIDDQFRNSLVRIAPTIPAPGGSRDSTGATDKSTSTPAPSKEAPSGNPGARPNANPAPRAPAPAGQQGSTSVPSVGTSNPQGAGAPSAGVAQDSAGTAGAPTQTTAPNKEDGKDKTPDNANSQEFDFKSYYELLDNAGLVTLTLPWSSRPSSRSFVQKLPGMIISVFLLSLGAPFWYKVLAQLLQLRSAIAGKDDAQREQRQGVTSSDTGAGSASAESSTKGTAVAATLPKGESGDLGAVG